MIETKQLRVAAGRFQIGPIDLRVDRGAYAVLVGPTGSGKTTLLEAIAGLRHVEAGGIHLGGVEVTSHRPADRHIGYAPQDAALFTTMTVAENLAFGLRARRVDQQRGADRKTIATRVNELADRLAITDLLTRKPPGLSGGEQRRVALGRALATRPDVLLLDEPLTSLDPETRHIVRTLLKELHAEQGFTALHVSHQEEDAKQLASVVLAMRDGCLTA